MSPCICVLHDALTFRLTLPRAVLKCCLQRQLDAARFCCIFADQAAHSQDTTRTHESFAAQSSWPHPFGSFEEQDIQRQTSGSNRQALTDATNGSALGDARDWQPPRQELGRFVPPGMVSYPTCSNCMLQFDTVTFMSQTACDQPCMYQLTMCIALCCLVSISALRTSVLEAMLV